jgi:hypothetical protein
MAGLVPAIHVDTQENSFKSMRRLNGVDARIKSGHDLSYPLRLLGVLALKSNHPVSHAGGWLVAMIFIDGAG